jgi:hypothetical protein
MYSLWGSQSLLLETFAWSFSILWGRAVSLKANTLEAHFPCHLQVYDIGNGLGLSARHTHHWIRQWQVVYCSMAWFCLCLVYCLGSFSVPSSKSTKLLWSFLLGCLHTHSSFLLFLTC